MAELSTQEIETDRKTLEEGTTLVQLWVKKIERAKKDEKDWRTDAKDAVEIYEADETKSVAFNILHSNVETLVPAVYNSTPVPDVRRRYGDPDPIAKQVVDLSERAISFSVDQYDFDAEMGAIARDALVPGRGVPRVRYRVETKGGQPEAAVSLERWPWDKFWHGPARSWAKVPWVVFEHELTRDALDAINPEIGQKIDLGKSGSGSDEDKEAEHGLMLTATVYEVWDKASKKVYFIAPCYLEAPLKVVDDPLGLEQFFPVLRPLQVIRRTSKMTPVCPYKVYKPLIDELDIVTKRISKLIRQLRVRGLYNTDLTNDFERLKDCDDGQFEGASNQSAAFAAGSGGLDKSIWVWPMEPTVAALQQLYVQRDQIKATIYEVTGISDIVRGASNANETATAQQIKSQWGSLRVQQVQNEIARLARDLFRAKVELFAKKFSDQQLMAMTSLPDQTKPEEVQAFPEVLKLFRSDQRSFRIDIETDSTVRADMTRNQEQMNQFMQGTAQFATAMAGVVQGMPQMAQPIMPVMVEVYTAFARKFKLGKQAEDALDSLSSTVQEAAQQPQEEQPDPAIEKAKMDMQVAQQKAQIEAQGLQGKLAYEERMAQLQEQKMMLEIQMKQIELQAKREEIAMNMEAKQSEMALKTEGQMRDFAMTQQSREADAKHAERANEIKISAMEKQAAMKSKPQNGGARP